MVRDPKFDLVFPAYSPDGKWIAYLKRGLTGMVQGVFLVHAEDATTEYFFDLCTKGADGSVELFEPFELDRPVGADSTPRCDRRLRRHALEPPKRCSAFAWPRSLRSDRRGAAAFRRRPEARTARLGSQR